MDLVKYIIDKGASMEESEEGFLGELMGKHDGQRQGARRP